jgi:hypothetical protein
MLPLPVAAAPDTGSKSRHSQLPHELKPLLSWQLMHIITSGNQLDASKTELPERFTVQQHSKPVTYTALLPTLALPEAVRPAPELSALLLRSSVRPAVSTVLFS